ncbi:MAG: CDP-glucose 4,6-dehydratase [Alphaproteobacteria bacterium]
MVQFADIYNNRKVLVTGHTGFKGSWLSLWLQKMKAEVTGISLKPETSPNHFDLLNLSIKNYLQNINDFNNVLDIFQKEKPEIVFHLAAQALVRRSYKNPLETWQNNIIGTANIIEACRLTPSVRAIIIITTDKCYENKEWVWGYRENDRLGGYDPYSASKACAEIVAASYRQSFFNNNDNSPLLATVRAGNVIGGGDWAEDRLIPDLVRAVADKQTLEIRSPKATRPWQHVLEPLSGYLLLGQRLLEGDKDCATSFNFGPDANGNKTVENVLNEAKKSWSHINWHQDNTPSPHEAGFLHLDCSKAKAMLGWRPLWNFECSIKKTAEWYQNYYENNKCISLSQLEEYSNEL